GSLAALVVNWFHGPLWLQVLIFVLVSGGLLLALWPFTKKFLNPNVTATNIDLSRHWYHPLKITKMSLNIIIAISASSKIIPAL
ncbi:MAG: hypothetical protein IIW82_04930, partial [Clostridia bacterium]|nr:hypothetical protein [Clostridia bacterium]